jgi:threonylcarbamoyladenosine tRNA methylthiotransferase CDKAL1
VSALKQRVDSVVKEGIKQIWLTSEDTGAYGRDIGSNISILLKTLVDSLPDDVMLRVFLSFSR